MPAYLDRFEYDIFLSYAWAGNVDLDLDKAWVRALHQRLSNDLRGRFAAPDRRPPKIFLDIVESPTGNVSTKFRNAVTSSALFLAIVDAHFCLKPDKNANPPTKGCFCLQELEWFASQASPVWNGPANLDQRIFKVQTMPVGDGEIPGPLRDQPQIWFAEGDISGQTQNFYRSPIAAIELKPDSRIYANYHDLVNKLAHVLETMRKLQDQSPIERFYVSEPGPATDSAADPTAEPWPYTRALASSLRPHEVVSVTRGNYPSDVEYQNAWKTAIELSGRSVHILNETILSSPSLRLDWVLQLTMAVKRKGCRTTIWPDAEIKKDDPRLVQLRSELKQVFVEQAESSWPDNLEWPEQDFESLSTHLANTVSRAHGGMAGEAAALVALAGQQPAPVGVAGGAAGPGAPVGQQAPPVVWNQIFFYCRGKDFVRLRETVVEMKDLQLVPSFYEPSQKKKAIELNQTNIQNSVISLVYWGGANNLDVRDAFVLCVTTKPEDEVIFGLDPADDERDTRSRQFQKARAVPLPTHEPKRAARILHRLVQERLNHAQHPPPPAGGPM